MASTKVLITAPLVVVITTLMVAVPALTKEIIVGDEAGWKLDFNYQDWAKGKDFQVGDKLIFKYKKGSHNVIKVDGNGFKECSKPENSEIMASGNDEISLSSPGRKWYICGVADHCESGMKLLINVQSQGSSDSSSAPELIAPMIAAAFFVFLFIIKI